jgi:catechol 2,3-dioxygenase-like lactoylglutathione lyase family enzyme
MINRLNHVSIFVLDQDSAYNFYVNKLGFKVHTDAPMGPGARWLTVNPPEQPDLEIALMAISEGMMFTKESAEAMRKLVTAGTFGFGVFECNDLLATYEELKAKGVEFSKAPTQEFYGFEALFKDDSGNWFSLGEKAK